MRAIFIEILSKEVILEEETAHHLINVLRVKKGQKVLGLNGKGVKAEYLLDEVTKKKINLTKINEEIIERPHAIDIAVGKVKKEALSLILKQACELGVENIIIYESEYSQNYRLNLERLNKILVSGIEQSNSAYLPQIVESKIGEIDYSKYERVVYFSSQRDTSAGNIDLVGDILLFIGPEGGLSSDEEEKLAQMKNSHRIHLNIPIMRAPTAVSCAMGYLFAKLNN